MKLLIYLRFLRPLRSLVIVAFYTGCASWIFGAKIFHLDPGTAWLIALAVALPLLLGNFIAGAAHEPMHRSFALLLPGIRQRQRAAAAVSVLVTALATTGGVAFANPTVSPLATFGLACALVSLPCIDRRQGWARLGSGLASVSIWLFSCLAVGPNLAPALNSFPWVFLLGGLGMSSACLAKGFSRDYLRARAHTLFMAYQTICFSYIYRRGMLARWQAEVAAQNNQLKPGGSTTGRDWKIRSVGSTSLDWMRVFWHANYGGRKRGSFLEVQLPGAAMTFINASVVSGVASFANHTEFWTNLAQVAGTESAENPAGAMLQPGMIVLCGLMLLPQRLSYPLSRVQLARIEFWQVAAQSAASLGLVTVSILFASLLGQFVSGKILPGYGLPALLTLDLQMAVLLPLFIAVGKLKRPVVRIFAGVPTVAAMMLTPSITSHWSNQILTIPGILSLLVAAAASQWMLWRRMQRHYATTDMQVGSGFINPLGLGRATPH